MTHINILDSRCIDLLKHIATHLDFTSSENLINVVNSKRSIIKKAVKLSCEEELKSKNEALTNVDKQQIENLNINVVDFVDKPIFWELLKIHKGNSNGYTQMDFSFLASEGQDVWDSCYRYFSAICHKKNIVQLNFSGLDLQEIPAVLLEETFQSSFCNVKEIDLSVKNSNISLEALPLLVLVYPCLEKFFVRTNMSLANLEFFNPDQFFYYDQGRVQVKYGDEEGAGDIFLQNVSTGKLVQICYFQNSPEEGQDY